MYTYYIYTCIRIYVYISILMCGRIKESHWVISKILLGDK